MLRKAGYRTGFIGKFGIKVEEGEIDSMSDTVALGRFPYFQEVNGEMRHLTDILGDRAVEFLRDCSPEEPFCLAITFPETADAAFFDALPELTMCLPGLGQS